MADQGPAYNPEIERVLLGACLYPDTRDAVWEYGPSAALFYLPKHEWMFQAILAVRARGGVTDMLSVAAELRAMGRFADVGGNAYVADCLVEYERTQPVLSALFENARMFYARRTVRSVLAEAQEAVAQGAFLATPGALAAVLDATRGKLVQVGETTLPALGGLVAETTVALAEQYVATPVVPTGFVALDARLAGGFRAPSLIVEGGRTSIGKSTFAEQVAVYGAQQGKQVIYVSLETSVEDLCLRTAARMAGLPMGLLLQPHLFSIEQRMQVVQGGALLRERIADRFRVWDVSGVSMMEIAARARTEHAQVPIDMLVIDYLGLLRPELDFRNQSEASVIASQTRQARELAKGLGCVVFLVVQLNREAAKRRDHRPTITDIRGSDAVAHDADVVLLLHRAGYYEQHEAGKLPPEQEPAEIYIGKNRFGPCGVVSVGWQGPRVRFVNLEPDVAAATG